jgi:hypothetical protein
MYVINAHIKFSYTHMLFTRREFFVAFTVIVPIKQKFNKSHAMITEDYTEAGGTHHMHMIPILM